MTGASQNTSPTSAPLALSPTATAWAPVTMQADFAPPDD